MARFNGFRDRLCDPQNVVPRPARHPASFHFLPEETT